MKQPKYQNSAGRLLAALESYSEANSPKNWSYVYPGGSFKNGFLNIAELHLLLEQFLTDLDESTLSEDQKTEIRDGVQDLHKIIEPTNIASNSLKIASAQKAVLSLSGTMLMRDGDLDNDDLKDIEKAISDIRDLVLNADISPTLKKALMELIRLSRDAIDRYNVNGAKGLKKAYCTMVGEAMLLFNEHKSEAGREVLKKSGVAEKVMHLLAGFDKVLLKVGEHREALQWITEIGRTICN